MGMTGNLSNFFQSSLHNFKEQKAELINGFRFLHLAIIVVIVIATRDRDRNIEKIDHDHDERSRL